MKNGILATLLFSVIAILSACGGFDEESAGQESKKQLEDFFATYDKQEIVADNLDPETIEPTIDKVSAFFTDKFEKKVMQALEENNSGVPNYRDKHLFFLETNFEDESADPKGQTEFHNTYEIELYEIDEEREKVLYKLEDKSEGPKKMNIGISMILDQGEWKIDSMEE